ncbi:2-iminobutanoate/2-iminopropanoate deaminase-like isoform X2 [Antedon mediterranea]
MYVSGQLGMNPETLNLVPGGIGPETEQALKNMGAVLRAGNIDYSHVIKCTVMLADINDFNEMNTIYSNYFSDNRPARVAFQAGALPKGARVEIDAIAMVDQIKEIN